MLCVLLAYGLESRVVLQVIVAIGQAQSTLADVEHVLGGIFGVLMDDGADQCLHADSVVMRHPRSQLRLVREAADAGKGALQGLGTHMLYGSLVHER